MSTCIKELSRTEDKRSIKQGFAELRQEIRNYKNDLIKLMFLLSIAYIEIIFAAALIVR